MKSFDQITRRTHLYLGLFLMPWLMMYGISSCLISHPTWFQSDPPRTWQPLFEREYHRPIPDAVDLRAVAADILKDCQLEGAFWVQRPKPEEIRINRFRFWDDTRLTYSITDRRLRAEQQQVQWNQVLKRIHFRGGFQQSTFWDTFWAVLVDAACVGILVWIGSGLLMWWRLERLRIWGALAVGAGIFSFLLLIWRL